MARYIMKKQGGDHAGKKYIAEGVDYSTGEIMLEPEYATMSLKPGIGQLWYERFGWTDCHAHDFVVMDGKRIKPPRYYDTLLERKDPDKLESIKQRRKQNRDQDVSPERLQVRYDVLKARLSTLVRRMENAEV